MNSHHPLRPKLGQAFKAALLEGGAKALRGKTLAIQRVSPSNLEVQILDKDGAVLIHMTQVNLEVGATLQVIDMDQAFNVTLSE